MKKQKIYLFIKSFEFAEKTNDTFLKGTIYNTRGIILSKAYKNYIKAKARFWIALWCVVTRPQAVTGIGSR